MSTHGSHKPVTKIRWHRAIRALSMLLLAGASLTSYAYTTDISPTPLYLGSGVEPNVVYIIDDSGSMGLSYIGASCSGDHDTKRGTSAKYNTLYYDPTVTYAPPVDDTGTSFPDSDFANAKDNGYDSGSSTTDLSANYIATWAASGSGCTSGTYTDGDVTSISGYDSDGKGPAYYHIFDPTNTNCTSTNPADEDCYDYVQVTSTSGTGGTDERTNFANWYSYYRTRLLTAKAGTSLAFDKLGRKYRIGYGKINKYSTTIDGVSTGALQRGVRNFEGNDRKDFFDWLFAVDRETFTPLRKSLNYVGQYYSRTDDQGPYSTTPGVSGGSLLSCQTNYTVLMTDGYWTDGSSYDADTSGARDNVDGTDSVSAITGPDGATYTYTAVSPYEDSHNNTLADVAMYYWKRDLTNLKNNVAINNDDPAFWQHMVTLSIGLGVPTSVDPTDAFDAIGDTSTTITWDDPDYGSDLDKADDFLHAAVNGHGGFYNAQSPQAFAVSMTNALKKVAGRESSAASIATNSTRIDTGTYIYQAKYDSRDWHGEIRAISINADGSIGSAVSGWDGTGNLGAYTSRNIYTHNGSSAVSFVYGSLSPTQQAALNSSADLANYIRGDKSNELSNGGSYRDRTYLLGDIVDSDPWFVGQANFGYNILGGDEGDEYNTFLHNMETRNPMLYVGANDGMLHAYDAETGDEKFAYIPSVVIPNLKYLADPFYGVSVDHTFYVNASPKAGDVYIDVGSGDEWRTVLVGSTGQGGKSVFALDVTDPDNFTTSNIMWEFNYKAGTACTAGVTGCEDVGYTLGQPAVVRLENGQWAAIFGNGYNSDNQTSQLFIVDIETGRLIKAIDTGVGGSTDVSPPDSPNGLSTPIVADTDGNRSADTVYAGDLHGNLWKFDISDDTNTSNWDVAIKTGTNNKPLFVARGPSNEVQPIFSKPQVGRNKAGGGFIVYFGTGKYFETGDNIVTTPADVMTFYGIFDDDSNSATVVRSTVAADNELLQQEIYHEELVTYTNGPANVEQYIRLVTKNALTTEKGWYIDLISADPAKTAGYGTVGERVIAEPLLWEDRVIFTTLIPNEDACSFGGDSWIMEVDPQTGGQLDFSVFDLNVDSGVDTGDEWGNTPVSGTKRTGIIKRPAPICADDKCYKYTSSSSGKVDVVTNKGVDSAGRQSWEQLK